MINLDFADVHRLAAVNELIEPLRRAFAASASKPARAHHDIGTSDDPGTLLLMPAWRSAASIGVKITTVFPKNPSKGRPSITGVYLLMDWSTGRPAALIDGRALTLLRTAAVSALAADILAPRDTEVLLMVGTGELSQYLARGHLAARRFRSIEVWGRDPGKAERKAAQLREAGLPARARSDLETLARTADVISCATMADVALIKGAWLKPSCHLDLVGSFTPVMREADDDCFKGATVVVDAPSALSESGDLIGPLASGAIDPAEIMLLESLVSRGNALSGPCRTVFKSVGVALADLAVAEYLLDRARI